jgi:hypothetical protein
LGAARCAGGGSVSVNAIIHLDGVSGLLTFIDPLRLEVIGQRDIGDALFEAAIARTR